MAGRRTVRSWAWRLVGCVLILGGALGGMYRVRVRLTVAALGDPGSTASTEIMQRTRSWQARSRAADVLPAVLFGDSFVLYAGEPVLGPALTAVLAAEGIRSDLLEIAYAGLSAFPFYYQLEPVLAGRPRLAVVEVNLRTFADDWGRQAGLRFPELSADVSLEGAWRVRRLLATQRLGLLDPIVFRLEEAAGIRSAVDGLRLLGQQTLEAIGASLNDALGLRVRSKGEKFAHFLPPELDVATARAWYDRDFTRHPNAAVLRELLAGLRAGGAVTVVFVPPVNMARITALGLSEELGLRDRLAALREAVDARDEEWLDLHGMFGARQFRDALHLKPDAVRVVAGTIASRLSERLHRSPLDGRDHDHDRRSRS